MFVYKVRLLRSMVLPEHGRVITYTIPLEKRLTERDCKRVQKALRNVLSIEYVPYSERVGK